jgi:hypothetical protein
LRNQTYHCCVQQQWQQRFMQQHTRCVSTSTSSQEEGVIHEIWGVVHLLQAQQGITNTVLARLLHTHGQVYCKGVLQYMHGLGVKSIVGGGMGFNHLLQAGTVHALK